MQSVYFKDFLDSTTSVRFVGGGEFNPTVEDDPKLVAENVSLGVGFDPPVPIQQDQHNVQMISKYGTFQSILRSAHS